MNGLHKIRLKDIVAEKEELNIQKEMENKEILREKKHSMKVNYEMLFESIINLGKGSKKKPLNL